MAFKKQPETQHEATRKKQLLHHPVEQHGEVSRLPPPEAENPPEHARLRREQQLLSKIRSESVVNLNTDIDSRDDRRSLNHIITTVVETLSPGLIIDHGEFKLLQEYLCAFDRFMLLREDALADGLELTVRQLHLTLGLVEYVRPILLRLALVA